MNKNSLVVFFMFLWLAVTGILFYYRIIGFYVAFVLAILVIGLFIFEFDQIHSTKTDSKIDEVPSENDDDYTGDYNS